MDSIARVEEGTCVCRGKSSQVFPRRAGLAGRPEPMGTEGKGALMTLEQLPNRLRVGPSSGCIYERVNAGSCGFPTYMGDRPADGWHAPPGFVLWLVGDNSMEPWIWLAVHAHWECPVPLVLEEGQPLFSIVGTDWLSPGFHVWDVVDPECSTGWRALGELETTLLPADDDEAAAGPGE